jgi:hypothetical protein
MRDRKIQTLDEGALLEEVRKAAVHVAKKAGIETSAPGVFAAE